MRWEVLIIPAIALAVWVLTTIFRGEENAPRVGPRPRRDGERPPRRPASDLDQFLADARRQRERERAPERRPVVLEEVAPRPERSRRRPGEPPGRRPTPPVAQPVPRAVPVVEIAETVLEPVPKKRPDRDRAVPVLEFAETIFEPARPAFPPAVQPPREEIALTVTARLGVSPAPAGRAAALPPALARLPQLLRDPRTAAAAFVLREIFDAPRCRRRK